MNKFLWILLLLPLGACQGEGAADALADEPPPIDQGLKDQVKGPHLIEVAEVQRMYKAEEPFKVIEISKPEGYATGHLPGALRFWRPDYESKDYPYGGMRMSAADFAKLLGSNGISPDDFLVVYDEKGCVDAARFMWMLLLYGHERTAVMNGGKTAWTMAGYPLSNEEPTLDPPVAYTFAHPLDEREHVAELEDLILAINDSNTLIVDTREPEEYAGLPYIDGGICYPYKKGAYTFGHIPTAIHLNWSDAVDLKYDHRFKCQRSLTYNLKKAGITPDKNIIVYCQSGARSTHTAYVLKELMGYPNVRNYDGSWIEWSYHYVHGGKVAVARDLDEDEHRERLVALQRQLDSKPVLRPSVN